MKKWYRLNEIADFENINNFFKATGTPTLEANLQAIDLWSEDDFEALFDDQSEKSIYLTESVAPWQGFKNKYTQWLNRNKNFIANELYTLLKKFNPIYNYDKHEVHSGDDTTTKTPEEWIQTRTETPDDWKRTETQTPTNWQKENTKSYTNYHETETETPTNWENTRTETPTNWQKQIDHSVSNGYKETESQKPTSWKKETQTEGTPETNNNTATRNQIIPFNGSDFANVSQSITVESKKVSETQSGTFDVERTQTGTKTDTETQTGTYQVTEEQAGTYERDRTKTGTETDTETQSGTYTVETTEEGSKVETIEQAGTMEDKTEYGHIIDVTGNIGVTTTAQMIAEVLNLYDTDFVKRWLMRFFNEYCYYVKEC